MFTIAPKRFSLTVAAVLAILGALLLMSAASALAATSAQQVYETPEAGPTPSPLPELPGPPAGSVQQPPFTPQTTSGPPPVVAGSGVPVPTTYPCIPGEGTGAGSGSGTPPNAEECAPAPEDGTAVRNDVTPGPRQPVPVGEVAPESGPTPAAGGDTLPVTGLDLLIVLAAAATAAGVGLTLRKAAR